MILIGGRPRSLPGSEAGMEPGGSDVTKQDAIKIIVAEVRFRNNNQSCYCSWLGSQHSPQCRAIRLALQVLDPQNKYVWPDPEEVISIVNKEQTK